MTDTTQRTFTAGDGTKYHFEVRHRPHTGTIKPWEIWSRSLDGRWMRPSGSFKTKESAERKLGLINRAGFGLSD